MFSPESGKQDPIELIPHGTLCKAVFVAKEVKTGKQSGATYIDLELRVCDGPYEGRTIFEMVMNPFDPKASEGGKKMGILALTRIGEAIGMFNPAKPETYNRYNDPKTTIFDVLRDIDGQTVAVRVKVENGKDGHADKNRVSEWLTPNPNSGSGFKGWTELLNGAGNPPQRQSAFTGGSSQPQAQTATTGSSGPTWLQKPNGDKPPF